MQILLYYNPLQHKNQIDSHEMKTNVQNRLINDSNILTIIEIIDTGLKLHTSLNEREAFLTTGVITVYIAKFIR